MSLLSALGAIASGDRIYAADVRQLHYEELLASGYAPDASDFGGYAPLTNPATITGAWQINRQNVTGFSHGLDIQFVHLGGLAGGPAIQEGHGLNLNVQFNPGPTTNRGMQSQKITATITGATQNAGLDAMDLSTIIDVNRTAATQLSMGISAAASKFNTTDDSVIGGSIIAGQFVTNLHAGKTAMVGEQISLTSDIGSTATVAYGVQYLAPVILGAVQTRMAAIYIDDWSAAGVAANFGGSTPNGYAIYAVGGDVYFGGRIGFNGTQPIAKPTINGAKGGNTALAALLTALQSYGLVIDATT